MTGRLLRFAVNGLCLLSLLACLATAWLWGRARPGVWDGANVSAGPVYVNAWSFPSGMGVSVVRDWDAPPGVWLEPAVAPADPDERAFYFLPDRRRWRNWQWGPWRGYAGTSWTHVGADGRFARLTQSEAEARFAALTAPGYGRSPPLREWAVYDVPHWHLLIATAAAPALWGIGRGRRAWRRRRRARLGLCRACGYDLRATPEQCPECGAAAAGPRRTESA